MDHVFSNKHELSKDFFVNCNIKINEIPIRLRPKIYIPIKATEMLQTLNTRHHDFGLAVL